MILDYIFYRVYKEYCKYRKEGNPLRRSRLCLLALSHVYILPLSLNIAALYGKSGSLLNVFPYVFIVTFVFINIRNRYNEKTVKKITSKYEKTNHVKIPIFFIWLLVVFSMVIGYILTALLNLFVMGPLGLVGCLRNNF